MSTMALVTIFLVFVALLAGDVALAHDVSAGDVEKIVERQGLQVGLFLWLGAKHMVTGYDHLLFLLGVIFYLRTFREVAIFVSLFAAGHSLTLIAGVLAGWDVNPYFIDAIIGLSVVYKGFDNLGGFDRLFGERPNEKLAVFTFGLFHGLGLATRLQDLGLGPDGLLGNLISFNVGVELGQLAALAVILLLLRVMPRSLGSAKVGTGINIGIVFAGISLIAYQLTQYSRSLI